MPLAIGLAALLLPGIATSQSMPEGWSSELSAYYYLLEDEPDFLLGIASADRGALHLEARYNYEDLKTFSAFAGWNLETGDKVQLAVTPLVGLAVGRTDGFVGGVEASIRTGRFELYTEGEYLVDAHDRDDDFAYMWTELTADLTDWLTLGLVAQRTRVFRQDVDIQSALLARFTVGRLSASGYLFDPGNAPFVMLGLAFSP